MSELPINSSFSIKLPTLQIGIDSTSLGAFKKCARYYYYSIVQGYQPRDLSVHLAFGLELHGAREAYEHQKVAGDSHDEALDFVLDKLLRNTWNSALRKPIVWDHKLKTRRTLIQSVVWYLDALAQDDPLETVILANGKPAVELSFRFDSGIATKSTGEVFQLCGHLDRIAKFGLEYVIPDIKTTGSSISPKFFEGFTPGNQFSLYSIAGKVAFGFPIHRLIVDAIQVGVGFSRFQRAPIERSEAQLNEWIQGTARWLAVLEACAYDAQALPEANREEAYPQNDVSCSMYGGCAFQSICSRSPNQRKTWLKGEFVRRVWDPLRSRGDI